MAVLHKCAKQGLNDLSTVSVWRSEFRECACTVYSCYCFGVTIRQAWSGRENEGHWSM